MIELTGRVSVRRNWYGRKIRIVEERSSTMMKARDGLTLISRESTTSWRDEKYQDFFELADIISGLQCRLGHKVQQ